MAKLPANVSDVTTAPATTPATTSQDVMQIGDPLTYGASLVTRPKKVRVNLNLDDASNYTMRIYRVTNGNPKKPGSQAYHDFLHYRDGMTVLAYLTDARMPRRRARGNIQWDVEHGFIRLEKAG